MVVLVVCGGGGGLVVVTRQSDVGYVPKGSGSEESGLKCHKWSWLCHMSHSVVLCRVPKVIMVILQISVG